MAGDDLSDEQLMLMFRYGSRAAFELLFEAYRGPVYHFARRMLGSREAAEDACQDTFLRMIRSAETWRPTGKFRTWLYTIARNCCLNARRDARPDVAFRDAPSRAEGPGEAAARAELAGRIERAIADLPPPQREVLLLRVRNGLSYADIAEVTERPLGTVKTLLHRARLQLAKAVAEGV